MEQLDPRAIEAAQLGFVMSFGGEVLRKTVAAARGNSEIHAEIREQDEEPVAPPPPPPKARGDDSRM